MSEALHEKKMRLRALYREYNEIQNLPEDCCSVADGKRFDELSVEINNLSDEIEKDRVDAQTY